MNNQQIEIVIRELKDLDNLISSHKFFFMPKSGNIILELESIPILEKEKWQKKLRRYYFACGCKEGAVASILLFCLFWIYSVFDKSLSIILSWEAWLLSGLMILVGAVLGKALGLAYAKYALKYSVRKLKLLYAESPKNKTLN
jgi:hypothetical protein